MDSDSCQLIFKSQFETTLFLLFVMESSVLMMEKKKNMSPNDATRRLQHDIFLCSVASFIRRGSVSSWV